MVNPIISVNGVIPVTSAPQSDVPPTTQGYGMTLGSMELNELGDPIPPFLLGTGLVSFPVTYEFEEYALVESGGQVTRVPLSGQTIDWSASEIDESGSLSIKFGVTTFYGLAGKAFSTFQYTFLDFSCILDENGNEKPASWTVRMKHS